jgi:hypothetical protein
MRLLCWAATMRSLRGRSGIHGRHRAGNALRLVAEQKLDGIGNVVNAGEVTERAAAHDLLALRVDKTVSYLSVEETAKIETDEVKAPAFAALDLRNRRSQSLFGLRATAMTQ